MSADTCVDCDESQHVIELHNYAWHWRCRRCGTRTKVPTATRYPEAHDERARAAQIARVRRGARVVDPVRFAAACELADPPPERALPLIVGVGICLLTFLGSVYLGAHVYHWITR